MEVEGAGGDVAEGLRRIESMAPNQPLVLMLLPHDQDVPPVWHTLAGVYTSVLTLAVVPAHMAHMTSAHFCSRSPSPCCWSSVPRLACNSSAQGRSHGCG